MTVKECLEKYMEEGNHAPRTKQNIQDKIKARYYDPIIDLEVENLSNDILKEWVDGLAERFAPNTITGIWCVFHRAAQMYCNINFKCKRPPLKKSEEKLNLDPDDFTKMLLYSNKTVFLAILLSYYANMNDHELETLKYKDVYYDNNAICLYSKIECINRVWVHSENGDQDRFMRFALVPEELMELIGQGKPEDTVLYKDGRWISTKFGIMCKKYLGKNYHFMNMKTYGLYKRIYVNPIGIIENQAVFSFDKNDKTVYECLNDYISETGRKSGREFINVFDDIKDVMLKDLKKELLENFFDGLSQKYSIWMLKKVYFLLEKALLSESKGLFHLDKWDIKLYSVINRMNKGVVHKIVPFGLKEGRRLMDFADSELKKCMLLSGYGNFTLTQIMQLKFKNVDAENRTITLGERTATFTKAMIRFIGQGEAEETIIKSNSNKIVYALKVLSKNMNINIDFTSLRGAYIEQE